MTTKSEWWVVAADVPSPQVVRVLREDGQTRKVIVERASVVGWRAEYGSGLWYGSTPRMAATAMAAGCGWPVVEILAPGELTRAEALDGARREEREACAEVCDAVDAEWCDGGKVTRPAATAAERIRALPATAGTAR